MIEVTGEAHLSELKSNADILLAYLAPPTCNVGESMKDKVSDMVSKVGVIAAHIDTSAHPEVSGQHLVLAFPTILIFVHGREFDRLSRIISMGDLERSLARAIEIVNDN